MAGQDRELSELMEEVIRESEDEGLDPDHDLSWDHLDSHEPDFESDYHE